MVFMRAKEVDPESKGRLGEIVWRLQSKYTWTLRGAAHSKQQSGLQRIRG